MRTKEERLLDVIGDTKDRNVLATVGHENADPQMKTDVHHVEFREVPKLPEKDLKRMRIRNAILGGFAAAAVIAGGIVLWNSLQNNIIETNPAQQSSTEPVVTIYQPGGSDDVSVTEEDRFEQITDTSMPECGLDPWTEEYRNFTFPWRYEFAEVKDGFMKYIDPEKYIEWGEKAHIWAQGTPYRLEESHNVYSFIKFMGIPWETAAQALEETGFSEEEINTMKSDDIEKIIKLETSEYSVVIGEKVFSPKWLYYHTGDDYTEAGITATQVEIMLPLYEKLGLTEEAWDAFSSKLNRFIEENKKHEEKRKYVIPNDETDMTETLITGNSALKILEERFYGTWKRTPATGGDYDTLTFAYNYGYDERNLMGFDFDFEGFHRPFAIGETDDIWYMECINSGESEVFVIEKGEPKVMYCTGLIYYNGYDNSPAVDLSEDWVSRYEYEETLIDTTVRPGEISVLGQDKLFSIYGEDFERVLHENINSGLRGDYGRHYITGDDMMTAKSRRYLVSRDENSVTLGIRFYEQNEYEMYMNHEYPVGDDGVEVLDDNDEPQPPTEYYFAVTFRKRENGWTFGYGQLSDVYADLPAQIYRSSQMERYVTELTLNDVQLRGDEIIFQSGSLRINDTMEYGKTGITAETDSVGSAWIAALNGFYTRTDIRLFNYSLSDGRVLATVWLPAPGKSGWIVLMYCYDGETLKALRNGDGGLEPLVADIGDVRVEGDMIYVTWSADAAALAPNSGIPTGTTTYTISESGNSLIEVD